MIDKGNESIDKTYINATPRKHHHTMVPNDLIFNRSVSSKAVRFLSILLAKNIANKSVFDTVSSVVKEGKDSIYAGIKELSDAGYIMRRRVRNKLTKKIVGSIYLCTGIAGEFKIGLKDAITDNDLELVPISIKRAFDTKMRKKPSQKTSSGKPGRGLFLTPKKPRPENPDEGYGNPRPENPDEVFYSGKSNSRPEQSNASGTRNQVDSEGIGKTTFTENFTRKSRFRTVYIKDNIKNNIKDNTNITVRKNFSDRKDNGSSRYKKYAIMLNDILLSAKKTYKEKPPAQWADSIKKLHKLDKFPLGEIRRALDWYKDNVGDKYSPQCFSGESFRRKFVSLIAAVDRSKLPSNGSRKYTGDKSDLKKYDDMDITQLNNDTGETRHGKAKDLRDKPWD